MSNQPAPERPVIPGVIPYVEYYTGETRLLTILTGSGGPQHAPVVSIDGRNYLAPWGEVTFEIPVERNVHVSIALTGELVSPASLVIPPCSDRLALAYRRASWGQLDSSLEPVTSYLR